MFFRWLAGSFLALVVVSSSAFAEQVTLEGAQGLKSAIQKQLEFRQSLKEAMGADMMVAGELKVEPAGSYYKVTFPHISEKYPDGRVFDMGNLALNAMPGSTDKEWKVSFSIPAPLYMKDAAGRLLWQVDMGTQKASGVWSDDLQGFSRLNADYKDVKFTVNETFSVAPFELKLAGVTLGTDITLGSGGFYSGSAGVLLSGLSSAAEEMSLKIGKVEVESKVKDFDPKVTHQFAEQVRAMGETKGSSLNTGSSQKDSLTLFNMITDMAGKSSDAFDSTFSISDLSVSGKNKTGESVSFSLGKGQIGFRAADFRSGLVKFGVNLGYEKAVSSGTSKYLTLLLPSRFSADWSFNNLPYAKLVDVGRSALSGGSQKASQANPLSVVAQIPQILTESGANLAQKTEATGPQYTLKSEGVVKANSKAVKGFTAEQNMEIDGLDSLISQLNKQSKIVDNPDSGDIQSTLGVLTMLQMTGQQKPGTSTIRTYRLTLDELGKTLLNGSDLSAFSNGK